MRKWLWVGVAVLIVVGGGIAVAASGGGDESKPLLVTAAVEKRDLREEVTVQGTLGRVEQRTINAATNSVVSQVVAKDGETLAAGQSVLALDGRSAVTADGVLPFFRKLDVGAEGNDVLELEQILQSSGYSPGRVDQVYTEQTRFALAQWQAAHGYPGSAPQSKQTVTVSLQQGSGYKLGPQTAAGATIAPAAPLAARDASARTGAAKAAPALAKGRVTAVPAAVHAQVVSTTLTIQALTETVNEGAPASFQVVANPATHPQLSFTVSLSGTAGAGDVVAPGPFTLPHRRGDDRHPDPDRAGQRRRARQDARRDAQRRVLTTRSGTPRRRRRRSSPTTCLSSRSPVRPR